jgi:hypothetical protein
MTDHEAMKLSQVLVLSGSKKASPSGELTYRRKPIFGKSDYDLLFHRTGDIRQRFLLS